MSNERPSHPPEASANDAEKRPSVHVITPEALVENERQAAKERANIERLITEHVEGSITLEPRMKEYLSEYLRTHQGQWREYDGEDIVFNGFYPDYDRRVIEAVFDVFGQDMADDIPMPEWMKK